MTAYTQSFSPTGRQHALPFSVRVIQTIALREVARQLAQPANLMAQAIQLGFFFLVYAIGMGSMIGKTGGITFTAFIFPGVIMIHLATSASTMGLSFAWDREFGFIRELLVAPPPRWTLPVGKAWGAALLVGGQCALLLLLAPLADIPVTAASWAKSVLVCAATAVAFNLVGLIIAVLVRRAESAQGVIQIAMFPLLFLSGAIFRPDTAPGWLAMIIGLNPLTYCVDLLRQTLLPEMGTIPTMAGPLVESVALAFASGIGIVLVTAKMKR